MCVCVRVCALVCRERVCVCVCVHHELFSMKAARRAALKKWKNGELSAEQKSSFEKDMQSALLGMPNGLLELQFCILLRRSVPRSIARLLDRSVARSFCRSIAQRC